MEVSLAEGYKTLTYTLRYHAGGKDAKLWWDCVLTHLFLYPLTLILSLKAATYQAQWTPGLHAFILKPAALHPSFSHIRFLPKILLARLRPWITSKTNKQTAWWNLWACFCPAFHLDNKNPSVWKRGQAIHRYVRQGNVVHLLICWKFTLNRAWSSNNVHLSVYRAKEGEKHPT